MAVRSIIESSGRGPNSMVQNPDQRDFSGNTDNTPLMSASCPIDLNIDQDGIDETCNVENFEDGHFPTLRTNYDRQAHTHHKDQRNRQNLSMETLHDSLKIIEKVFGNI